MTEGPSLLSLAASGVYGLVMLACLLAGITAQQFRQLPGHGRTWAVLALFFGLLVLLRLFDVEEVLRQDLRASLRASGSYDERRSFQGPLVATILMLAGVGGILLTYRWARRIAGRRNFARMAAVGAALVLIVLMAFRIASLHALDVLLYGPLKLNWVIDLGSSLVVLLAALQYVRLVRARP